MSAKKQECFEKQFWCMNVYFQLWNDIKHLMEIFWSTRSRLMRPESIYVTPETKVDFSICKHPLSTTSDKIKRSVVMTDSCNIFYNLFLALKQLFLGNAILHIWFCRCRCARVAPLTWCHALEDHLCVLMGSTWKSNL